MAGRIFISYRRDDERATAARIRDRLAASFGKRDVFMDVDNLLAGQRFDRDINVTLGQQVFDIAKAQRKAEIQSHRILYDLGWKTTAAI